MADTEHADLAARISDALLDGRNNAPNLAEAVDAPEDAVRGRLEAMVDDGRVRHVGNGVYERADAATPTAESALTATLDMPFEDAVLAVQLEHELVGFETVQVTRLDQYVQAVIDEEIARTALVVVCHPVIAHDAVSIDSTLAGLLPCTTAVLERPDGAVDVIHYSATKAIRDLGVAPAGSEAAVEALVEMTGETMAEVWEGVEALAARDVE